MKQILRKTERLQTKEGKEARERRARPLRGGEVGGLTDTLREHEGLQDDLDAECEAEPGEDELVSAVERVDAKDHDDWCTTISLRTGTSAGLRGTRTFAYTHYPRRTRALEPYEPPTTAGSGETTAFLLYL